MKISAKAFFESDEGMMLRSELVAMTKSEDYNTRTMYSTQDTNGQTFVQKHIKYMSQFPDLDYNQYVSNLKLMTKRR